MANDPEQRLSQLSAKMALVISRYKAMKLSRQQARERIAELESEIQRLRARLAELDRKVEYLKVANAIAMDGDSVAAARSELSEILREIDKCIEQLKY